RSQMLRKESNVLVVDAYNANPSSMKAALDNFAVMNARCKVAMLGDMRELGQDSVAEHIAVLRQALDSGLHTVYIVGDEFRKALSEVSLPAGADVRWYPDSETLAKEIESRPIENSLVLVKGSRGIRMEKVIPAIR
ncbi:MAG: glutamate ligase domain-containing protein, partial [Candidatus Cryptobacteroides sp.]